MPALILALKCVPRVQKEALSSETTLLVNKETYRGTICVARNLKRNLGGVCCKLYQFAFSHYIICASIISKK